MHATVRRAVFALPAAAAGKVRTSSGQNKVSTRAEPSDGRLAYLSTIRTAGRERRQGGVEVREYEQDAANGVARSRNVAPAARQGLSGEGHSQRGPRTVLGLSRQLSAVRAFESEVSVLVWDVVLA